MAEITYLQLHQISKHFGEFSALHDIDLSIERGEFVCFLGPSGCGKTTLLRIIAGLEVQSQGRIVQDGRDISTLPASRRDYGIVFQSYALFPNLRVADNVAYGLVNRKTPKAACAQRVAELLELVGLPGIQGKFPAQLSGGQQQRVALARALATSPGLLLLDEPLSALDAQERLRLRQEIRSLQRRLGVTTIMVTHDQEEALSVADRIVVMRQGVVEQVGTPLTVYREPASAFVADFVGKVNVLQGHGVGGRLYVGTLNLPGQHPPNGPVRAYVRPEDVVLNPPESAPGVVQARLERIDFLGDHCQLHVVAPALDNSALMLYASWHQISQAMLEVGATLSVQVLPERVKVF